MKLISCFFLCFILNAFSQVEELQNSQLKRKKVIDPSASSQTTPRKRYDFAQHVNPFIGTDAHGHTYPAAAAPFGMMQLGPDTRYNGWDGCSGYHYSDSVIYGFSHTHLSGTGVEDLCDLLIVPQQGKALIEPGYKNPKGYGAKFSHKNEKAEPGYYEVKLNNRIQVKLATKERSGIHSYSFDNKTEVKYILIDLDHRDKLLDYSLNILSKKQVSGSRNSKAWASNQHFYFFLESEQEFVKAKVITKKGKHKLLLTYPKECQQINLKVGISAVDIDGAKKNLFDEITTWNIEEIKNITRNNWNVELNKLHFVSEDKDVMTNFYSAMYHAYLCPTIFSDVDGRFRGNDGAIHTSTSHQQYSIFSLWDTYRTAHPLYTLTQQKRTGDFVNSFLEIYKQIGTLPVWELNGNETNCMIGYHSVSVIADAYNKGITNFNTELALQAMVTSAKKEELGKLFFATQGFIGSRDEPESVSKTLEYAYDDWCISEFAKSLKNQEIAEEFYRRSHNFMNIFDPQTKFMRPRNGGVWHAPFIPSEVNFNFTEANSFQYSLAAPQNIVVLRDLLGGKDSLEAWLDRLFTTSSKLDGRHQSDITGLIGQYAHGNEPSHHMAYLYNYTNNPSKTQERIDQILKEMYHPTPEGLSGNEDCGQMSAWYAMSAIGLYPICPGKPIYTFGRPIQDYANFHFENGNTFYIKTLNNSSDNKYIQNINLNGVNYSKLYITHDDLLRGGTLIFTMGDKPNSDLKNYLSDISEKDSLNENIIPVPYFTATRNTFNDSITTEIKCIEIPNSMIRYTLDGSEPSLNSEIYQNPLTFHETTTLKAKLYRYKGNIGASDNPGQKIAIVYQLDDKKAVSTTFYKLNKGTNIDLKTKYNNQYTGGGDQALIDGIIGGDDFRTGTWQGYQGDNAEGIISFDEARKIQNVKISCLQDVKSWIFMPTSIEIEISYDGIKFEKTIVSKINYQSTIEGNFREKFNIDLNAKSPIKKIRYKIVNRGTCPKGHLGEGDKSWIFIDEIELL
ncbi:MAG: GH92 family glycosyl hydrolase [Flavobacteriia bacterium]